MLFTLAPVLLMLPAQAETPPGWLFAGSAPDAYIGEIDDEESHDGGSSARYASIVPRPRGFGTMMQSFSADNYVGERVRLTAWVKTEEVKKWAGLWMRVDGANPATQLAFDNMSSRPLTGSQDWQEVEIVLDVDDTATGIALGILITGAGTVWLDDLSFEVVDHTVPVTDMMTEGRYEPSNLDFED